ncbi:MAG: VWA-like domain-containing protein [Bacteroidales bacterium]|nr:VWA-like domain-containing protein [Bacteroidales bacterium]
MTIKERINRIIEGWYIYENALFEISLTHILRENQNMMCYMRCGAGSIEYNPAKLEVLPDDALESFLQIECVRIILKHPYERQPTDCPPLVRLIASNIVIGNHYQLPGVRIPTADDFNLKRGESYEWYAYHLLEDGQFGGKTFNQNNPGDSSEETWNSNSNASAASAADSTALWQEDSAMQGYIGLTIEKISNSNNWGNIPGNLVQTILANVKAKIDYRQVLAGFRASVLSSKRYLTRMRPNRRTGFDNMGSIRRLTTRLLVAIDVSSSVSDPSLNVFLSVVNKAFRYGVEQLDLVTFDTEIHDIIPFKKARSKIQITGRGGTCFQPAIDYAQANRYDGLLIFTDGEAPAPAMPDHPRFGLVWVFDTESHYRANSPFLRSTGRCCPITL